MMRTVTLLMASMIGAWSCQAQIVLNGQCLVKGTSGLWWGDKVPGGQYEVYRSPDGGNFEQIGKSAGNEFIDIHGNDDTAALFYYKVRNCANNRTSPVIAVGNSSNLLAAGNFENEKEGSAYPKAVPSFAGRNREKVGHEITREGRGDGKAYKITVPPGEKITIRNSSPYFRIVPNHKYLVQAHIKIRDGGVGSLGGQTLTENMKMCTGLRVPYFQGQAVSEDDGWKLFQHAFTSASDAAFVQLWAICWESQGVTIFDDLAIIDTRLQVLEQVNPNELTADKRLSELQAKLRNPSQTIKDYMDAVTQYSERIAQVKTGQHKNRLLQLK